MHWKLKAAGFIGVGAAALCQVAVSSAQRPAVICAGPDRVLRLVDGGICSGSQVTVPASVGPPPTSPQTDANSSTASQLSQDVARLQARLDTLNTSAAFEVVNARGGPILRIGRDATRLYNAQGIVVAEMTGGNEGGVITALSSQASLRVSLQASASDAGMTVAEGGAPRLLMSRGTSGGYSFKVVGDVAGKQVIAGLGESAAHTGTLVVGDRSGRLGASLSISGSKGTVAAFNASGAAVASLAEGKTGGVLALTDAAAEPTVKMGINDGRYGVVLTGPKAGLPYVPRSGLPGSYLLGCAAGPACSPGGGDQ